VNKNLKLQAAKMAIPFDRKDCFPHTSPLFIFHSFLQTHLTLSDSLFQLYSTIIGMIWELSLVRVVSMSLRVSPHIHGITQHPIGAIAPNNKEGF
jgi:hypothetical protein